MSNGNTKSEPLSVKLKKLSKQELNKRDVFGRSIIHIICILGRFDLLKHLLLNPNVNIFITDYESGWTGLHHSIFYGKISCAKLLLGHNSELVRVKDRNGLTAMDIYHLKYSYTNLNIFPSSIGVDDTNYTQRKANDNSFNNNVPDKIWWDKDIRGGSEVFTFGINVNNHLGTGDSDDKLKTPYRVDIENKRLDNYNLSIAERLVKPRIKDIKISKNHSIILTNETKGNLLIAGNPSRGRLGHGKSTPNYKFTELEYFADDHITNVAISDDHTLVLTSNGEVYSWGLNNYLELGYPTDRIKEKTDTFSNEPKRIIQTLKKLDVQGISCSKIHSAAFSDYTLVLWGLNIGQMDFITTGETVKFGKQKGIVQTPRKMEFQNKIKQVITTDNSTIVLLDNFECHIMHNGNHLRIQLPLFKALNNEFEYFRPTKFSKRKSIIKLVSKDCSKIGILYDDGSVSNFGVDMFSKSSNIKYNTVWSPRNNHLKCHDVDIGKDGSIIICTKAGSAYKRISRVGEKSDYKFTKIDRISKVVKVCCDSLFTSFGFIKDDVDQLPLNLSKNQFLVDINYLSPLTPSISNRRKSKLVEPNCIENRYSVDFLNKPSMETTEESDTIKLFQNKFTLDDEKDVETDPLYNSYINRWNSSQKLRDTFEKINSSEIINVLNRKDLKYYLNTNDFTSGKDYDLMFDIDDCHIGVHSSILKFIPIFENIHESDIVLDDDVIFHKVEDGCISVENLHVQSLLLVLNLLYTGSYLKIWDSFSGFNRPPIMREIKDQTMKLLKPFKLVDDLQRPIYDIFENFSDWENFDNDVLVKLKDDEELRCCSYILSARSAFFETLFSERWDLDTQIVDFNHVSKNVFEIVLKYIYGYEQLSLFDDFDEIQSVADFINLQFDIIEISDELLLFGLKDISQLMIKDFITHENVFLLLQHSEIMNCNMLIGECLWFIYNNVDLVLFDSQYNDELLSQNIIKRIDRYFRWMNRVNKISAADETLFWYDSDTGDTVRTFLYHLKDFNSQFLLEDSFEPLFDIKEARKENKSPKLEPIKTKTKLPSPPPVVSVNMDRKKSVSIDPIVSWSKFDHNVTDSSAIEFTDEEFQPVVNRRRRSSGKRASSSTTTIAPSPLSNSSITPSKSIPIPTGQQGQSKPMYSTRNNSVHSLTEQHWPGMNENSPNYGSPNGLSPFSNWGNSSGNLTPMNLSSSPSTRKKSDPLVPSSSASITTSLSPSNNSMVGSSNKLSFNGSGNKMSQKERKRLMKTNDNDVTPSKTKSNSPWNVSNPKPKPKPKAKSIPNDKTTIPSSFLAAQEDALAEETISMPSLAGIIHEEEHKAMGLLNERKSLVEIQQEEEFALWWESESKRVQQEQENLLKSFNSNNGNGNNNKKPNGNSKKKQYNNSRNRKRSVN
ncbi:Inhibitor of Bruton tyrosine kinase [Wickerhamomyces ciferrii]|uniref:Inhibitor of Bruton tyrosine kinase n=1 Tax=Wickerhamomyces ciferrii (strain ATCC 14091 / BCRC 22168 / CBS 111 / JCM 3599 / NBRC 0793 / NRRL Y-1031 F-60-10) TaxID=1206466 RepID=K0KG07_WICCF|nr:Inhibitor of Bruton tyrosine kinase [Wickerhamomyces ciferrii]CCH44090.1 Inhibitor of Bruton tyrosine kinase [Wickerhamomyces ciferrii]